MQFNSKTIDLYLKQSILRLFLQKIPIKKLFTADPHCNHVWKLWRKSIYTCLLLLTFLNAISFKKNNEFLPEIQNFREYFLKKMQSNNYLSKIPNEITLESSCRVKFTPVSCKELRVSTFIWKIISFNPCNG